MVVTATVKLTKGYVAIVDTADLQMVSPYKWCASEHKRGRVYAMAWINGRLVTMQAFLMGFPSVDVDHENADTLDNRRLNLRKATRSQNNANQRKRLDCSSRYKGVFLHKQTGKWCAQICSLGVKRHLGLYIHDFDAATAYNFAAHEAFGEFARFNKATEI